MFSKKCSPSPHLLVLMQLIFLLAFLLICNFFFSETLVLFPIHLLLNTFTGLIWYGVAIVAVAIIAWCFGE
ncbi:MAG: hypothetical protein WA896_23290 [Spirulinaceae cyanobacterium]